MMEEEATSPRSEVTSPVKTESARDDWRPYHEDLITKLLLEKVRDATASQNVSKLEEAIEACEQHGLGEHKDVMHGKQRLAVITARNALKESVDSGRILFIRSEILKIEQNKRIHKELQQDVIEAEQFIAEVKRRSLVTDKILGLNRKTLTEIRRCFNPPVPMRRTLQAALLLLGENEETTSEWAMCLRLVNPQGRGGMIKRILDFDRNQIHPEISSRAKDILTHPYDDREKKEVTDEEIERMTKDYRKKFIYIMDLSSVRQASPAAAAFYVWSMGVIDECESRYEGDEEPKPASIKRQKQILRKPSLVPEKPQPSPTIKKRYVVQDDVYLQRKYDYAK